MKKDSKNHRQNTVALQQDELSRLGSMPAHDHGWSIVKIIATLILTICWIAPAAASAATNAPISNPSAILEDSTNRSLTITGITGTGTIVITAASSNTNIVATPSVTYTSPGTNATLTYGPVANANGTANITVTVTDDAPSTNTTAFTVTVTAVNDAPSFTLSTNSVVVAEDAVAQSITNFVTSASVGPSDESSQTYSYAVTAASTNMFSAQPQIGTNGILSFTLAANKFGTNLITVRMIDDGGTANGGRDSATNTFYVTVANINDAPVFGTITNRTLSEDFGTTNITYALTDVDTTIANVAITGSSSATNIVTVTTTGDTTNRTVSLRSVANANGTATITLIANDGALTTTNTFDVTVSPVNDAPSLLSLANKTLNEDFAATNFTFSVSDVDTDVTNITVTATSSNTNILSSTDIVISGTSTNRTVAFTSLTNQFGNLTVSFVGTDGTNSVTNNITLTINSVNDRPSFTLSTNLITLTKNAASQTISNFAQSISMGPTNESTQTGTFRLATTTNAFFKTVPAINSSGTLTFLVASNAYGFAPVTVYLQDSGGTANGGINNSLTNTFYIVATNVNSAPVFVGITNRTLLEDRSTNVTFTLTDVDNANVRLTASSSSNALVSVSVSGTGTSRTMTLTPGSNKNGGPANITLIADDGYQTVTNTFEVTVTAVNDAPSFTLSADRIAIAEDAGSQTVSNLIVSASAGPSDESSQTLTYSVSTLATNFFSSQPSIDTNGTLSFTVATNQFGTNLVNVIVTDSGGSLNGGRDRATNALYVAVSSSNDAPVLSSFNALTVTEDFGTTNISFTVTDVDTTISRISISASSSDTNLVRLASTGSTTNRILRLTSITNATGTATITVIANDGALTATNTFDLTVSGGNDAPAIATIPALTLLEDAAVTNLTVTISDPDTELTNVTVTATSSDTNIIADNLVVSGTGASRTLPLTLLTNSYGTNTITLIASDGAASATNTFQVRVTPVNDAPSFGLSTNTVVIAEDAGVQSITNFLTSISSGPSNESSQTYSFTATSSSAAFYSAAPTIATNGLLTFTVKTNQTGTNLVTVIMTDNGGVLNRGINKATNTFAIVVNSADDPPSMSTIAAQTKLEDFGSTNLLFTITDPDTVATNITITTTSSDTNVVLASVGGTAARPAITLTSVTNASGSSTIEYIADDGSTSVTNTFSVTITAVNDAPTISTLANLTIFEDASVTNISFTVSDVDTDLTNVTTTAAAVTSGLVTLSVTNTDATNRVLVVNTATNANGRSVVNIIASDGSASRTNSFLLTITAVNDAPSFNLSTNRITVAEDAGSLTVSNLITSASAGATNESVQKLTYYTSTSSNAFYSVLPKIGATGHLTFKTANNAYGTNSVSVYAIDNGGTSYGGVNLSTTNTFDIVVTNVNDAPVITIIPNLTILEDAGTTNISLTVSDLDSATTNITLSATSSKTNLVTVSATNDNGTYTVSITTETNVNSTVSGSATISVIASDGSESRTNTFALTVRAVNDPPTFTLLTNTVYAEKYETIQTVTGFIVDPSKGPTSDETNQTYTFTVTSDNTALFKTQPTISAAGVLTFKPASTAGTATVSVVMRDSGGTLNGGNNSSSAATLSIVIGDNPFTSLAGQYNGLFYETNAVNHDRSGFVNVQVSNIGVISEYVLIAGTSNRFSGQFDIQNAEASFAVGTTAMRMNLALDISTNDTQMISGSITNTNGWNAILLADRSLYGTENIVPYIGEYTMRIPGNHSDATSTPGGDGFASVIVDDNGLISMSGYLSDGTAVAQTTSISKDGVWPLYIPVYNRGTNGSILSWITFNNTNANDAFSGASLSWIKKAAALGATYSGGFTNDAIPQGSTYYTWEGIGISSGQVILGGGNLSAPITNNVTVYFDTIEVDPSATNQLTLQFSPASGKVTGSFKDPSRNATNQIYGILLQQTNQVFGYFIGTNQSGYFILK